MVRPSCYVKAGVEAHESHCRFSSIAIVCAALTRTPGQLGKAIARVGRPQAYSSQSAWLSNTQRSELDRGQAFVRSDKFK